MSIGSVSDCATRLHGLRLSHQRRRPQAARSTANVGRFDRKRTCAVAPRSARSSCASRPHPPLAGAARSSLRLRHYRRRLGRLRAGAPARPRRAASAPGRSRRSGDAPRHCRPAGLARTSGQPGRLALCDDPAAGAGRPDRSVSARQSSWRFERDQRPRLSAGSPRRV